MSQTRTNAAYTSEFRHEFEADTATLFRRRLKWLLLTLLVLAFLDFSVVWIGSAVERASETDIPVIGADLSWTPAFERAYLALSTLTVVVCGASYIAIRRSRVPRANLARISTWLVVGLGCMFVAAALVTKKPAYFMFEIMIVHLLAACFLPWTPMQALAPIGMVIGFYGLAAFFVDGFQSASHVWAAVFSPLMGMPGVFVAWLKHSRRLEQYKIAALQRRYGEFRRELFDAQRVHEAMFPAPVTDGPVRFWYEYEPMRAIGGDFVFVSRPERHAGARMSVVLLDVTGHGITAALTVNRLYGELQRVFAEDPDLTPGQVLKLLNRYVHLTLVGHSIYATALCLRVCAASGQIEYASAGHPPAFLRGVDGTVHELESTALVLGACGDTDFDPAPALHRFGPGDVVIAYTDGAIEAADDHGRMLGVRGMRGLVAGTPQHVALLARRSLSSKPMEDSAGAWARCILRAVEQHRSGPPRDDTLVVEIARPIGAAHSRAHPTPPDTAPIAAVG